MADHNSFVGIRCVGVVLVQLDRKQVEGSCYSGRAFHHVFRVRLDQRPLVNNYYLGHAFLHVSLVQLDRKLVVDNCCAGQVFHLSVGFHSQLDYLAEKN